MQSGFGLSAPGLELEALGYKILSVTGDGFSGLRQGFWGIPFQMCHVHMERIVIQGTTKKPELEAGFVLLTLAKNLHETDSVTFNRRFKQYIEKYRDFLNEKTEHPISGEKSWTHEPLRQAVRSLQNFQKFLFTFEQDRRIPKTTNSLEGHFRHINEILAIHDAYGINDITCQIRLSSGVGEQTVFQAIELPLLTV